MWREGLRFTCPFSQPRRCDLTRHTLTLYLLLLLPIVSASVREAKCHLVLQLSVTWCYSCHLVLQLFHLVLQLCRLVSQLSVTSSCLTHCPPTVIIFPDKTDDGETCRPLGGGDGECLDLFLLPSVVSTFKKVHPALCGFRGKVPIVCCPKSF
ncbi:Clotting factor B-like 3 [Homarus americanus]|uniref:Clotting factor B-like 3 n=1 Tax=Homarus americanus TaxID=6706 RepID=A0A8J5NA52_HOMAM|nr:Clotting factor B-like 3 [Homarus americanus]